MDVVPTGYPAPPLNQLYANIVGILQIVLIGMALLTDKVLPPQWRENKMGVIFGVFLVTNMISGALTKTSAFEIYVGRKLVWSTLASQRTPNLNDLVQSFASIGVAIQTS